MIKPIFWTFLFLIMMLAIDQFFVQVPPVHPAHAAVSNFYQDLRGRLIELTLGDTKKQPRSIEAVIDKLQKNKKTEQPEATKPKKKKAETTTEKPASKTQRYIYSDGKGELHFADSLDEVPDKYRAQAQSMSR